MASRSSGEMGRRNPMSILVMRGFIFSRRTSNWFLSNLKYAWNLSSWLRSSLTKLNSPFAERFNNVSCTQILLDWFFRRRLIWIATARAFFCDKLRYIVSKNWQTTINFPEWEEVLALPSNGESLALVDDVYLSSAASAQRLCALPGGERRADFLSCEGPFRKLRLAIFWQQPG